jgi:hypothetical protein
MQAMRRLARHLFTFLSAVSLLLCMAVCVLWVRSYAAKEWLTYQKTEPSNRLWWKFTLVSCPGQLYIGFGRVDFNGDGLAERYQDSTRNPEGFWYLRQPPESQWGQFPQGFKPTRADEVLGRLGFQFILSDVHRWPAGALSFRRAFIPYWFVTMMTVVLPFMWWRRRHRRPIRVRGHRCVNCGYDLRATPDRCPECGTVPQANANT